MHFCALHFIFVRLLYNVPIVNGVNGLLRAFLQKKGFIGSNNVLMD